MTMVVSVRSLRAAAAAALLLVAFLTTTDARKLRVHIGTWNVDSGVPREGLEEVAGVSAGAPLPDVIVVGMQEITMRPEQALINRLLTSDKWTKALVPDLAKWGYQKVKTVRMVGVLLNVFVHVEHVPHVSMVAHSKVPTGFGGMFGNKGGVMVALDLYDSRLRFVNSHLPAHDEELSKRIDHYKIIRDGIDDLKDADHFFWLGDLNFRLEDKSLTPEWIRNLIQKDDIETLLSVDQLKDVMARGIAFAEFAEQPITFKPTFKMMPESEEYNMKRRPAWTDRVLYTPSEKVEPVFYSSLPHLRQSDHRPVVAQFFVEV